VGYNAQAVRLRAGGGMPSFLNFLVPGLTNFERFGISPASLKFKAQDEEAGYQAATLRSSLDHIRFSISVGLVMIAILGFADPLIYQHEELHYVYIIRFGILLPMGLVFLCLTARATYFLRFKLFNSLLVTAFGAMFLPLVYRTDLTILIYNFPTVMMVSTYAFFFCGMSFQYGVMSAGTFNILFSIAIWSIKIPLAVAFAVNMHMIVMLLLIAMAAYQRELVSRQLFVSERREREALARQHESDHRYLQWSRQLARFLRHEVRQPVAQINSSIELAQLALDDFNPIKPHVANAAFATRQVWNLIERASHATDIEAFIRQSTPELVDLKKLLANLVDGYQQTFSGVSFRFESRHIVLAEVDPILVKEAVSNLLANAASFSEDDSTIQVSLNQSGSYAIIKVRNKGPLLEGQADELFGLFASTRSGPSSEHEGLGLYLVRLIAEHYGGRAELSNLDDASGVEATITLPVLI
jgi:signal transduction histidine kinase